MSEASTQRKSESDSNHERNEQGHSAISWVREFISAVPPPLAPEGRGQVLRAREPLLEGGGELGIPVHFDAVLIRLAATHQDPVEPFSRSPHGDVGLRMTGFDHGLATVGPQDPFTLAIR